MIYQKTFVNFIIFALVTITLDLIPSSAPSVVVVVADDDETCIYWKGIILTIKK